MVHILVGHEASKNLEAAFLVDENLKGEIVVLRDTLGIGPIKTEGDETWSSLRTSFWKTIDPSFQEDLNDEELLLQTIAKAQEEEEPICFWMAPCVSDICAYFWMLPYFKNYPGMLHLIQINGLPFLNEKGQLFYPVNFSQIPPKEFVKTKRLLKEVSASEYELEGDEWDRLGSDNTWVRIYEGGKKLISKPNSFFDGAIKSAMSDAFLKANKVIHEAQKKITQTLSSTYLEWRLHELIRDQQVLSNGDVQKGLKEFEVKLNTPILDTQP